MSADRAPHLWLRIIVPQIGAIGPGKIGLLRAIDRVHSISAAARDLGMSYRRAWLLLDETRHILGEDIIETRAGGADRGGASLTQAGRNLIVSYERICAAAAKAANDELTHLLPTAKRTHRNVASSRQKNKKLTPAP